MLKIKASRDWGPTEFSIIKLDTFWMFHPLYTTFIRARAALGLSSLGGGSRNFIDLADQFHDPPPTPSFIETGDGASATMDLGWLRGHESLHLTMGLEVHE